MGCTCACVTRLAHASGFHAPTRLPMRITVSPHPWGLCQLATPSGAGAAGPPHFIELDSPGGALPSGEARWRRQAAGCRLQAGRAGGQAGCRDLPCVSAVPGQKEGGAGALAFREPGMWRNALRCLQLLPGLGLELGGGAWSLVSSSHSTAKPWQELGRITCGLPRASAQLEQGRWLRSFA